MLIINSSRWKFGKIVSKCYWQVLKGFNSCISKKVNFLWISPYSLNNWPQGKQWVLFPRDLQCSPRRSRGEYWHQADWRASFPSFQGARPDHVRVESSSCFVARELVSFDPWHVTRSPPIGNRIWVGRQITLFPGPRSRKTVGFMEKITFTQLSPHILEPDCGSLFWKIP